MKISINQLALATDLIVRVNKEVLIPMGKNPMGIMVFSPVGIGKTEVISGLVNQTGHACFGLPLHYVPVGQMSMDELSFVPDVKTTQNGRCGRAYLAPNWVDEPALVFLDEVDRTQSPNLLDQAVSWVLDKQHPFRPADGSVIIMAGNGGYDDNTLEIDKRIRSRCVILDVEPRTEDLARYLVKTGCTEKDIANLRKYFIDDADTETGAPEAVRTGRTIFWAYMIMKYFKSNPEISKRYESVIKPVLSGLVRSDSASDIVSRHVLDKMGTPDLDKLDPNATCDLDPIAFGRWATEEFNNIANTCNGTPKLPSPQIPRLKKLIKYAETNNAETARLLTLQCKVRGFLNQISKKESDLTVNNKVNDSAKIEYTSVSGLETPEDCLKSTLDAMIKSNSIPSSIYYGTSDKSLDPADNYFPTFVQEKEKNKKIIK